MHAAQEALRSRPVRGSRPHLRHLQHRSWASQPAYFGGGFDLPMMRCVSCESFTCYVAFRVAQVETIGDAYIAAGGIPLWQPDHTLRYATHARCTQPSSSVS